MRRGRVRRFLPLVASLLLGACGSLLEPHPEGFVPPDAFFQNESQVDLAVTGIYAGVQTLHRQLQWAFAEFQSDNTSFQFNPANRGRSEFERIDEFTMTADNVFVVGYWDAAYNGISRANLVLAAINGVPFESDATRRARTGETRFFRAFHYFNLVRFFGGVPIVTSPLRTPGASAVPRRATTAEVYDRVVIPDLLAAIETLPAARDRSGRVTQAAARTMLAEVYLTRAEWNEAIAQLEVVTRLGYRLEPDYGRVFDPTNKGGPESILEIQYLGTDLSGEAANWMQAYFAPIGSGTAVVGAGVPGFSGVASAAGENQPTLDLIRAYEPGDRRREVSLRESYVNAAGETIRQPYINKYNYPLVGDNRQDVNWPLYRYGGVLLMLAEALVEAGRPAEALPYLNQVRARAGLPPLAVATREAVRRERRVELAFENVRWFDLLRWGMAERTMRAHGREEKAGKGVQGQGGTVADQAYTRIYALLPIPAREVMAYGYEQNPGW